MAREAAKPKKAAAKKDQPKKEKQVVQKAAKPANRVSKPAAKTARPGVKAAQAAAKAAPQAPKKTSVRGAKGKKGKVNRGDKFYCDECGLAVTVDEACGCAACDIICCGTEMQPTK
jgi:hypothetical protein